MTLEARAVACWGLVDSLYQLGEPKLVVLVLVEDSEATFAKLDFQKQGGPLEEAEEEEVEDGEEVEEVIRSEVSQDDLNRELDEYNQTA